MKEKRTLLNYCGLLCVMMVCVGIQERKTKLLIQNSAGIFL